MSGIIIALGGAPLGFFLSQSWYFFQWPISHDGIGGIGRSPLGRYVDTLRIKNQPIRWNRQKLVVDYLVVHCANKKESGYISRRWDYLESIWFRDYRNCRGLRHHSFPRTCRSEVLTYTATTSTSFHNYGTSDFDFFLEFYHD